MRAKTWTFICTAVPAAFIAGAASAQCGDPAAGDCCVANGTPGCSDLVCCEAICAADPFCCTTQWDTLCANAALAGCDPSACGGGGGGGGGGGDGATCAEPGEFFLGDNAFANGPTGIVVDMSGFCTMQFTPQFYNTNYYLFTAPLDGFYRMSTCNTATFDTKIAVMADCEPFFGVLACNDDGAGCTGFTSLIPAVELIGGITYKVIVGGYAAGTAVGSGSFNIEFLGDGGGGDCTKADQLFVGFNNFDTSTSFTSVDLSGICDPGPFGDDLIYNARFYRFTPPTSDIYTISTCNLAAFDTRLAVLEGCSPFDGVLACNDDGAGCAAFTSEIEFVELEAGVEYYIVVGGFSPADSGFGGIEISTFSPCDLGTATVFEAEGCGEDLNGGCNSSPLFPTEPIAVGDIVQGTFWADGGTRDTDWYLLTLAESTEVTLSIRSNLSCFAAFVDLGCGGIIGAPTTGDCPGTVSVCLPAGQYYVVALPSVFSGYPCGIAAGNDYTLELSGFPCTAVVCGSPETGDCCVANGTPFCNDAECCELICAADPFCCNTSWDTICANAAVVSCGVCGGGGGGGGSTCDDPGVMTLGANSFANGPTGIILDLTGICTMQFTQQLYNTNFYAFTPAQTGSYSFSTCSAANFDTKLAILQTCGDAFGGVLACNDDGPGCTGFTSLIESVDLVQGITYYVAIGGYAPGTLVGGGTLTIAISDGPPQPPANDDCANATVVGLGVSSFTNVLATGSLPGGCVTVNKDVWYSFTATGDESITVSICAAEGGSSTLDTAIKVFDACDGNLVACNDDSCGLQSRVTFTPVCGTTYKIAIGSWSTTATGSGNFVISQSGSCAPSCPGDLNGDNEVGAADLATLLNAWGTPAGDLNGDGTTDAQDLAALLSSWGSCN